MYLFEITNLPTRKNPSSRMLARGQGGPTLSSAQAAIEEQLKKVRLHPLAARRAASMVSESWTDFPEYGITIRAFPQTVTAQCAQRIGTGRCKRQVAVEQGNTRVLCWQHMAQR